MASDSGGSTSVWMSLEAPKFPRLRRNTVADVCIVGAGIAGITTAYLLARAHKRVIVLDDGEIGGGETGRTTAHLVNALDDRFVELERLHGQKGCRLAAESHSAAIDRIEAIVKTEKIRCDFTRLDGYLFVPPGEPTDILERELKATHRAGLSGVKLVKRAPLSSFDTGACLRFPRQAQFHPMKYLAKLAAAITRDGGHIFTGTHVDEIQDGSPATVKTSHGYVVTAGAVVVATNTPVNDIVTIHTKQAAYRTFVIGAPVPAGAVPTALYWDTPHPYHYVRVAGAKQNTGGDILIVGGEDHKTGQADDAAERFARLEAWTRERFPMIGPIKFRWSGQVMEPVDGLAFIGRNPTGEKNIYIATGDSGNGMTHGTIAGMLLTDLISGRENEWAALYDPGRITVRAGGAFAKENLNVAAQYADLVTPGEIDSVDQVPPRSGAVMRRGLTKIAIYRDESGSAHECSAICPHLGCVVGWNSKEKSWDCPCHGSRFDPYGKVINGPAITNLAPEVGEGRPRSGAAAMRRQRLPPKRATLRRG